MTGFLYGEPEPKERCPYCDALCCADFVDIGVGYTQCGPYHCERCRASEIGPYDEERSLSDVEHDKGWYAPKSEPGSSANTDDKGNIIRYFEADTIYRATYGIGPRYDKHGNFRGT